MIAVSFLAALGIVAFLVLSQVSKSSPPAASPAREATASANLQRAERARAEAQRKRAEAGERASRAAERAELQKERAQAKAEAEHAEAEAEAEALERGPDTKPRRSKPRASQKKKAPDGVNAKLPQAPPADTVDRIFRRIDTSDCPGPGKVGYTVQIKPDGTSKIAAVGPIMGPGGMLSCMRPKILGLRFPKSKEGARVKHVFELAGH